VRADGRALAPGLVVFMISPWVWRPKLLGLRVLGLVWAVLFWSWFRDTPGGETGRERDGTPNHPARQTLRPRVARVPWTASTERKPLANCWMYFGMAYGWYFYITWLPTY